MGQTKQQAASERLKARAWYTAGRMVEWFCPMCGATSLDIGVKCRAPLSELCAGFLRTEEVHQEFERNYDVLINN